MKILLFENGLPGQRVDIAGENVRAELEELLGGEVEWKRLTARLQLVVHKDAEREALPLRYTRYKPGHLPELIFGNAAVVRLGQDGKAHDVIKEDAEEVSLWIHMTED